MQQRGLSIPELFTLRNEDGVTFEDYMLSSYGIAISKNKDGERIITDMKTNQRWHPDREHIIKMMGTTTE